MLEKRFRDDLLLDEIRKNHDGLFVYSEQQNVDLSVYTTVLINFNLIDACSDIIGLNKIIDNALNLGKTLILLNVNDGRPLSRMIGMGLRGKCIIVRPYSKYRAFNVLGLYQQDMFDCGESNVNQNSDGSMCSSFAEGSCCECPDNECLSAFERLCAAKQARVIESILTTDFVVPQEFLCNTVGDTPASLPESQFKLNYLAIESIWNLSETQVTNNSSIMEITLIASYNPKYKYLRIRSVGAGFNPANGAGTTADWDFLLSMTENSIWDIFSEPFMKKGQVKALPALATKNLQAVTEAVWYGENTLTDTIGVQLYWKVDHFHCWVTGNWASYTENYHHKWRTVGYVDTPVYINFGSVFA